MRATRRLLCLLLLAAACGHRDPAPAPLRVFAAASLTGAFETLGRAFEQAHPGTQFEASYAGTPQLLLQLEQGAPADVFASADEPSMQKAVAAGHTAAAPVPFATNRLQIVVGPGNPKAVKGLADLARTDLRVVLCGPAVPAGRYVRQVLDAAGVKVASLSDEPSVKAVLAKVQLGEVDAGVVYATDVAAAGAKVAGVDLPPEQNVVAKYPIAVLGQGRNRVLAEAFVAFVRSPEGQRVLREAGFGAP